MNGQSDHFQRLAWRVAAALPGGAGTILVTSARHGEGRSYIAAALASALSQQTARPVALCDCAPIASPAPVFGHATSASGHDLLPPSGKDMAAWHPAGDSPVVRLPFGSGDLSTLFNGRNVQRAVDALRSHFGFAVLDGPLLAECGALCGSTDGTLLVVNSGQTRREVVQESLQSNPEVRLKTLGVVLNEVPRYIPRWLYRRIL